MTSLKLGSHSATGRPMVEIYDDAGQLVGCIYPMDDGSNSVHIVSNYFSEQQPVRPARGMLPVPGYLVRFRAKE